MAECCWRRQVFTYHPVIGWWHVAGLRARLPLGGTYHTVVTNSMGMRASRDYSTGRAPGRTRLVFLGDSYTAGDGVSNGQRFTDLLESRFPHLDALNFGLNGSGTDQQVLIFEHVARAFEADACVLCICVENIARNLYTCFPSLDTRQARVLFRPKPYFTLAHDGTLALHNQPVPTEVRPADALVDWQYVYPHVAGSADPYAVYGDRDGPPWKLMNALIGRLAQQVRGRPLLVVPMPMYQHYLGDLPATYWPRFAELDNPSAGVHAVDLLPAFLRRRRAERRRFRFPDDPHYTCAAHEVVADALEEFLQTRYPGLLCMTSGTAAVPDRQGAARRAR